MINFPLDEHVGPRDPWTDEPNRRSQNDKRVREQECRIRTGCRHNNDGQGLCVPDEQTLSSSLEPNITLCILKTHAGYEMVQFA